MTHQLLFVCAANVCRSPLMAFTFAEALTRDVDRGEWVVVSRGASVSRAQGMCKTAQSLIGSGGLAPELVTSHVSTQLDVLELREQQLVIVASREERAAVARMLPAMRTRTFTLKEALALGAIPADSEERQRAHRANGGSADALADYAAVLNQRRGRSVSAPAPKRRMPWSSASDPQDFPDVHHEGAKRHATTLKELREATRTLHRQLGDFLAAGH